jgi:hypothetical protein
LRAPLSDSRLVIDESLAFRTFERECGALCVLDAEL